MFICQSFFDILYSTYSLYSSKLLFSSYMFRAYLPSRGTKDIKSVPIAFLLLILCIATSTSLSSIYIFLPFVEYDNSSSDLY